MIDKQWWKEAIVYQIYPRSFKDSNGDGIGDIPGIIQKLDYIKSLGVDVIWLCPVYDSPNDDNGYDIRDYRNIHKEFGTMTDLENLLEGVHQRGMKLIMDLVVNHTSDEHEWFLQSKSSLDNPYRDFYFWKEGRNGGPPNNWKSFFGGDSWDYDPDTNQYYLHLFSKKQPDLNWENPKVREEIYDLMRFWLDKGIDGFRMDVIPLISKRTEFPDSDADTFTDTIHRFYANGPRVHEYLREMQHEVLANRDVMTVGEGPGITPDLGLLYVEKDRNELQMIFHFGHMYMDNGPGGKYDLCDWTLQEFKQVFKIWDEKLHHRGWLSIFLGNHDFPRIVSRFGDDGPYRKESAKLLATLLLSLRGTTYLYQGDEIGMSNVAFDSIDDYRDLETLNAYEEAGAAGKDLRQFMNIVHIQSRDNARTPVQWSDDPHSGFTDGTPWIRVNPNFKAINVAAQETDPDSVLNYYRKMIRFRKENPVLVYGDYLPLLKDHDRLYAYRRNDGDKTFLILLNFSSRNLILPLDDLGARHKDLYRVMGNYDKAVWIEEEKLELLPWEAVIFEEK